MSDVQTVFNSLKNSIIFQDDWNIPHQLTLFYPSGYVSVWHEREFYSVLQLFSDIGGALGLLLGVSLYSLAAVFNTVADFLVLNLNKVI